MKQILFERDKNENPKQQNQQLHEPAFRQNHRPSQGTFLAMISRL
jgi:hypothetical protein